MRNPPKIAVISISALLAALVFFEIILRSFWQMSGLKGELYQRSRNTILRYELKPNTRLGENIIINSDGFRGRGYPLQKERNTYRIVVIGDSVAFGRALPQDQTLPKRLEVFLTASCPGKKFEVLNMGVEGYNSLQELEVLEVRALKYNPDLAVVYYCLNDPDYPEYYFNKNFINRHSLLVRYVLYKAKKRLIKRDRVHRGIKNDADAYRYFYSTNCWLDAKKALLKMGDLTQSAGIRMVLLIVPEMQEAVKDFREGYPFWHINEMIEGIRHNNIFVIDPVREFSKRGIKKEELTVWGSYPNLKANDIIAGYALEKLKEKNINFCN